MHAQIVGAVRYSAPQTCSSNWRWVNTLPWPAIRGRQQAELYGRQVHGHSVAPDIVRPSPDPPPPRQKRAQLPGLSDADACWRRRESSCKPGWQLRHAKGLGQVVIGPASSAATLSSSRSRATGSGASAAGSSAQPGRQSRSLPSASGQTQVQHHDVGLAAGGLDQAAPGAFLVSNTCQPSSSSARRARSGGCWRRLQSAKCGVLVVVGFACDAHGIVGSFVHGPAARARAAVR